MIFFKFPDLGGESKTSPPPPSPRQMKGVGPSGYLAKGGVFLYAHSVEMNFGKPNPPKRVPRPNEITGHNKKVAGLDFVHRAGALENRALRQLSTVLDPSHCFSGWVLGCLNEFHVKRSKMHFMWFLVRKSRWRPLVNGQSDMEWF